MSAACRPEPARTRMPADKRAFIGDVGRRLTARHGMRKYYKPDQVRRATVDAGYSNGLVHWAYCIYLTSHDFHVVQLAEGVAGEYSTMKASVLAGLTSDGSFRDADLHLSWMEWQDIDVSSLLDWVDFS
jgi:hypothetical protein